MKDIATDKWSNLESVHLKNNKIKIVVLPKLGGKIASIYYKELDFELVAQHQNSEYVEAIGGEFAAGDASGLDDAFPNINEENIIVNNCLQHYPDHGEIWNKSFQYEIKNDKLHLNFHSDTFGYDYQKTVDIEDSSVILHYKISNSSNEAFPCLWAFHGLVRYEENMEIFYGDGVDSFLNVLESKELGEVGTIIPRNNQNYDFTKVPKKASKTMVKYYVEGAVKQGICGYRYPTQGAQCTIEYDAQKLPYLGMWLTAGGFRGDYNCALEPATSYYDSIQIATNNKSIYRLKKEEPLEFTMRITLKKIQENYNTRRIENE